MNYKEQLRAYLLGKLKEINLNSPNIYSPEFNTPTKKYDSTIYDTFKSKLGDSINVIDTLPARNANGDYTGWNIVYGNANNKGFIAILDNNLNIKSILTQYSTGTDFGKFIVLNVAENGNLYGLDYTDRVRIILLNNPILTLNDNYICVLRNSYYAQGRIANISSSETDYKAFALKSPIDARYIFCWTPYKITSVDQFLITYFKINVGASNDWQSWEPSWTATYGPDQDYGYIYAKDFITDWMEDSYDFTLIGVSIYNPEQKISFYRYSNSETIGKIKASVGRDLKKNLFPDDLFKNYSFVEYAPYEDIGIKFKNTKQFIVLWGCYTNKDYWIRSQFQDYIIKGYFNDTLLRQTYDYEEGQQFNPYPRFNLKLVNDTIVGNAFVQTFYSTSLGTSGSVYSIIADSYIKYLGGYNTNFNVRELSNYYERYTQDFNLFIVSNSFNLYTYSMYLNDTEGGYLLARNTISYNPNNINNDLVKNYANFINPYFIRLYSNNELIFDRNLTNLTISGNAFQATTQIPNTMINDISIDEEELFSKGRTTISNHTTTINKNIYETLFINFLYSIRVEDRNSSTRYLQNTSQNMVIAVCNPLENTISNESNYDYLSKNWEIVDDNGVIIPSSNIERNNDNIKFTIYPKESITRIGIKFKNNDIVYVGGNFTKGNAYTIIDKVGIE